MASLLREEESDEERLTLDARSSKRPSKWVLLLTGFAGIGSFSLGYDIGVTSGAMILLKEDFNLTYLWQTAVVSSTVAAAGVFALIGGFLNRRFGRKPVIMCASFLFILGAILAASSNTRTMLLAGRIIVGIGIGT